MDTINVTPRQTLSRRQCLGILGSAASLAILPRHVLGGNGYTSPNQKTTVACIGLGGQGLIDLSHLLPMDEVQVVAVCDVDREGEGYLSWEWTRGTERRTGGREPARRMVEDHYAEIRQRGQYRGCTTYFDYRELLANEDVDAVVIATPDHTHAVITMAALRKHKHVYCEKPLTYSVEEARRVTEAARQAGVATQLGNHGQAAEEARVTQEFILDGAIGPVHEVHEVQTSHFWEPPTSGTRPNERVEPPEGLDWDLWLGPAPERPFHPIYHPWYWRDWRDFGTSMLGDLGCHRLSTVFKALELEHPVAVQGECVELGPEIHPRKFRVHYRFPARKNHPPLDLYWYDGGYEPPPLKGFDKGQPRNGTIYVGERGTLLNHRLVPESAMKAYGRPPKVLPRSPGHYKEWVDACRGGPPAGSDFVRHGGLLTETPLLGNIAMRTAGTLSWDGPNLRFTNNDSANELLHRTYRDGWSL